MAAEKQLTTETSDAPSQKPPNPFLFLSLIPKLILKPFANFNNNNNNNDNESDKSVKRVDSEGSKTKTPDVVRFPVTQKSEVPPLKVENEDAQEDTNPIVLWQVYALGGFIILKWAWGKWQERKASAKKDASGEEEQPPAPVPAPAPAPAPAPTED
ncbi:hypothetical protein BVRB_4g086750 [Beta vulgaris subsp. vulgaris]|nr:hypothetical protein BVRB_4g086750 [Beta vulgaris subsp. vulgaris]